MSSINLTARILICSLCIIARLGAAPETLEKAIVELIESQEILGAQALVGENDLISLELNVGQRSALDDDSVDSDTLFCIGSCSKPYASATIVSLAQKGQLDLDVSIDQTLQAFSETRILDSDLNVGPPNLRQLLAHRAGIYSQKRGMNRQQARWIRDFRLTLEQSVAGIAKEALIFEPESEYAYSGAGYCVLGRVAEVATGNAFEALFQSELGAPLAFERTSYFPDANDPNIATGSIKGRPNPATPHLSKHFNLPLIGGSLYSTARECSRFARMILQRGRFGEHEVLSLESIDTFLSLPYEGQPYGLGWSVKSENGRPVQISHSGALASSRATIRIDLDTGRYAIVLYTLTDPSGSAETQRAINQAIIQALTS